MARAVAQKEDRQWSNPTSKSQPYSAGKDLIAGMHDFKIHGPWNFACVFFHFLPFSPYWGLWNLNDTNSSSLFLAQVQVWRTVSPETAWPALGVHHFHPCPAKSSIRRCKIWEISMETPSTLNSMFKWKSMTQRNQQLETGPWFLRTWSRRWMNEVWVDWSCGSLAAKRGSLTFTRFASPACKTWLCSAWRPLASRKFTWEKNDWEKKRWGHSQHLWSASIFDMSHPGFGVGEAVAAASVVESRWSLGAAGRSR